MGLSFYSRFLISFILSFFLFGQAWGRPAQADWTAECHNVVLVYVSQGQNGADTSTLQSEVKTQVGGTTCSALDKWKLPLDPPMIDLAATQAANPDIAIIQTKDGIKVNTPQAPGTFQIVKVVGQAQVKIGDSYASWPSSKKGSTRGQVAKDTVNIVNFGEERLITPENLIRNELLNTPLNNRFAVSPHSALDAAVHTLGVPDPEDPFSLIAIMQLSLALDYGAYLPPIPLTDGSTTEELSSVEMDSQHNIHVLTKRDLVDGPERLFMISTDAAGTPLHPPGELSVFGPSDPNILHEHNAMTIDGNDHLHVVFTELFEEGEDFENRVQGPYYVRSEDGGATWTSPVAIPPNQDQAAFFPSVAVSPVGSRVVVSYFASKHGEEDEPGAGPITVAVSDDGGGSFPTHTIIAWNSSPNDPGFDTHDKSKVALDPEDRIFVAYHVGFNQGSPEDPFFKRVYTLLKTSSDGGNSYGTPTLIHAEFFESNFSTSFSETMFTLAIDRLGRIDVLFPSDANEDCATWSYELTRRVDGALRFSR